MNRRLLVFIVAGLCACFMSAALFTACGETHTHSYTSHTKEATCTEKGLITYTCSCNDTYTEEIPALGHNEKTHAAQAPTCAEIGWKEYTTCKRAGCEYSTYEEIPATGAHTWDEGEITTAPTCIEKGVKTFTCTVCGTATYTEDVQALNHEEKTHQAQNPTCTEIGWKEYVTCEREGCGYTTYEEIPALKHDIKQHNAQAATCTAIGWKAYDTCSRCEYSSYEEIPMQHNAEGNDGYCVWCHLPESTSGLQYSQNADGTYTVTSIGACTATDIVIGFHNGKDVTSIGEEAFANCRTLTSITLSNSVTSIGNSAFSNCSNLINITIPDGVTSIGNSAFSNCSSLKNITLPHGITSISFSVFRNCSNLTSIVIPNSITSIDDMVFYNCNNLTSITIPDSVTFIGSYAFDNCTNLQYNVKNGLEYLGNTANPYVYLAGPSSTDITAATIENSCKVIGSNAFYNCSSLTNVVIGNSVTFIGNSAFRNCSSLTSVVIGDSVISIGNSAFYDCSSLTNIIIPNSVTSIETSAFRNCSSLTSITIPSSVTSIDPYAFYNCSSLTDIIFEDTSIWYRTTNYTDWQNKTRGTSTNVTNSSTNAMYFKSTHEEHYWYKL